MIFGEHAATTHQRIARLAADRGVHRAFSWLHLQEPRVRAWQSEVIAIPAPPFGEGPRALWFADRMRELGLHAVEIDEEGNALGLLRPPVQDEPVVLLSAHLDTVFAADTLMEFREEDSVLYGPGAADNGAGLAGLLATIAALRAAEIVPEVNVLFAANVGEEAEGDLRGMRYLFTRSPFASRICASIALEGAGTETVVTRGLGSRRFRVEMTGPGGHSWTDSDLPNPIVALASVISALAGQRLPEHPRTTLNIGRIAGGTSVTAVPQQAEASFDFRSTDTDQLLLLEVKLYQAVEDAVMTANGGRTAGRNGGSSASMGIPGGLQARIVRVGDRPAADLPADSRLLATVRAVDRHLRLRTEERLGSTDANIPLALGREAIAIGSGGTAAGIHTTHEWYDARGRGLALRRILLILLDVCGYGECRQ